MSVAWACTPEYGGGKDSGSSAVPRLQSSKPASQRTNAPARSAPQRTGSAGGQGSQGATGARGVANAGTSQA
ncbi:MAG: hypothetical protein M3N16_09195, partial [Actinomycetota bacterium]|nr:hypothetical protein [Actinomycetota bacterium]